MELTGTHAVEAPTPLWEDLIDIHVSPRAVFERRRGRAFLPVMVILTVLVAAFTVPTLMSLSGAMEATFRASLQSSGMEGAGPEDLARVARFSIIMGSIGALILTPLGIFLTGCVLWVAGKVVDAAMGLSAAVMIATWAAFPKVWALVASMVQGTLMDPERLSDVSLGPARLLDGSESALVASVLGRLDLFAIWGVALLAIGVATVARTSGRRGLAAAGITWVVSLLPSLVGAMLTPPA